MNKVDVAQATGLILPTRGWAPDFDKHPATRSPYNREPYVRAQLDDGTTVDAKAIGWTSQHVHLKWQDAAYEMRTRWVPASWVERISRDESSWKDPYDILE